MMFRKTISVTCAWLLVATGAWAQNVGTGLEPEPDESTTRVGTRGANFLEIPVGARAQSLGGSGTALIGGVEAMAWNVAAIAEATTFSVGWSYSELFAEADINHQFVGAILPIGSSSAFGVSLVALNSGDILRTSERFPEGGDPQLGDTFEFSGFAVALGWGQRITDRLDVGGAGKFISEGIDNARATWIGLDVGALFRTGLLGTTLGASIQNIGGDSNFEGSAIERQIGAAQDVFPVEDNITVAFETDDISLPTAFRFSAYFSVTGTPESWITTANPDHKLNLVADVFDAIDTPVEPSLGIEYNFKEIVSIRGGKRWFNENEDEFRDFADGLAFGGGLSFPLLGSRLGFDYAYTDMGLLDNVQTISIQFGS